MKKQLKKRLKKQLKKQLLNILLSTKPINLGISLFIVFSYDIDISPDKRLSSIRVEAFCRCICTLRLNCFERLHKNTRRNKHPAGVFFCCFKVFYRQFQPFCRYLLFFRHPLFCCFRCQQVTALFHHRLHFKQFLQIYCPTQTDCNRPKSQSCCCYTV